MSDRIKSDEPEEEEEIRLLRELLTRRRDGEFVSDEEGRRQTREMIDRKRKAIK